MTPRRPMAEISHCTGICGERTRYALDVSGEMNAKALRNLILQLEMFAGWLEDDERAERIEVQSEDAAAVYQHAASDTPAKPL